MAASPSDDTAGFIAMPTGIMFGMGWSRFLPPSSMMIFAAVSSFGAATAEQIWLFTDIGNRNLGANTPVWDEPHTWTDEELQCEHEDAPLSPDEPTTAAEANAAEAAAHAARIARIDSYSTGLGAPAVRTMGDALHFMTACRLLTVVTGEDGATRYRINLEPPLPEEILSLPEELRAREDRIRWEELHEPIAQQIIGLFTLPESGHPDSKRTSLQQLAGELGLDVETSRSGLVTLISDGDFTASRDPETVAADDDFHIHVDWELFAANRITVRLAPEE